MKKIILLLAVSVSLALQAQSFKVVIKNDSTLNGLKYKKANGVEPYLAYGAILVPKSTDQDLNKHLIFSNIFDIGAIYRFQPKMTSPFVLMTGLYFDIRTLRFGDNRFASRDLNGDVSLHESTADLKTSKLRSTYITVPLGVKYNFAKRQLTAKDEPYRNVKKGFSMALNVFGGFKISNSTIVKGKNLKNRDKKTDFGLNDLIYGGQLSLSLNDIGIFYRIEMNPYFKNDHFDNRQVMQVGLQLGF